MKILDVLYYYYYLFYIKILKDDTPHLLATLALSASESFLIIYLIKIIAAHVLCKVVLGKWGMIVITIVICFINYLFYQKTGRATNIVRSEPKFFDNDRFSVGITILFFLVTTSFLFWVADYVMYVIDKCG